MLSCIEIKKSFDGTVVLGGVTLSINRGERAALAAPNGTGKTTLFKILSGEMSPDSGEVILDPGVTVAHVRQEVSDTEKGLSLMELLVQRDDVELGARFESACGELGVSKETLERPLGELSGGEMAKAALLPLVAWERDLYLLDEPTNNLDMRGLRFLERFIQESRAAFLIVSHDRVLLDRLTSKTLALDSISHEIREYGMSFSEYLEVRRAEVQAAWEKFEDSQGEMRRLKGVASDFREWGKRGKERKKFNDNDKYIRGAMRERSSALAARAKRVEKRLEQMDEVERPKERLPFGLEFEPSVRSGELVFECKGASVERGGQLVGPFSIRVQRGERIAVTGDNGTGKSTLLGLLSGEIAPTAGEVRTGTNVLLGVLKQNPLEGGSEMSVMQAALAETTVEEKLVRRTLYRAGVDHEETSKKVSELSPGQRSRLTLAKLMLSGANTLILDEPSNHLDIEALEALESALDGFAGTVIAVTHDRAFLERLDPTREIKLG